MSIPGLDQAKILRPAYGIEYDAVAPIQLHPTLGNENSSKIFIWPGKSTELRAMKKPPPRD